MLKSFKFELSLNVSEKDASLVDQSLPEHDAAFRSRGPAERAETSTLRGKQNPGSFMAKDKVALRKPTGV